MSTSFLYFESGVSISRREIRRLSYEVKHRVDVKFRHGETVEFLGPYVNVRTKTEYRCVSCSHRWWAVPRNVGLLGTGCPKCYGTPKKTHKQHRKEVKKKSKGTVELVSRYMGANDYNEYHCLICDYYWESLSNNFLGCRGTGCPKCASKALGLSQRKTQSQYEQEVKVQHNGQIVVLGKYKTVHTKIKHGCVPCGYKWKAKPANVLSRGSGCPRCHGGAQITDKQYRKQLKKATDGEIEARESYVNANTPILHGCSKCDYGWKVRPADIIHVGVRCTRCRPVHYSQVSCDFVDAVSKATGLKFQSALNGGEHKIGFYRVDAFNSYLNLVIEFHGTYWHGWNDKRSKAYRRTIKRDRELAEQVNLVVVWQHDWTKNTDAVIERIKRTCSLLKGNSNKIA